MKILLFDNYDSFTYNLADYLCVAGAELLIIRNDECSMEQIPRLSFDAAVLSPGPSRPENAGLLMSFIENWVEKRPMLGVCLGFQAIGMHYGARLVRSREAVHGKTSKIVCATHAMYEGIPGQHAVCRYHSLRLQNIPPSLTVTASTEDGIPMAFAHNSFPVWAVQYHPEAVLTEHGHRYIANWMKMVVSLG